MCIMQSDFLSRLISILTEKIVISEDKMGRVRTKTVKKASRFIIEKYYTKEI